MGFNPEPSHRHGSVSKTAIVLANLGTPDAPTPAAVKAYLNAINKVVTAGREREAGHGRRAAPFAVLASPAVNA